MNRSHSTPLLTSIQMCAVQVGTTRLPIAPNNDRYYQGDNKHFMIGQDLIRWRVMVYGPRHWHRLASHVPELGWIDRNSTLTDDLFHVAAEHPGMSFYFTVEWVRYSNMIKKKAAEQGIDIDNRPFMVWAGPKWQAEEMNEKYKLAEKRKKSYYIQEDIEAEKESKGEDKEYE